MYIPKIDEWRSSRRFTDIVIEIDNRRFDCHRMVLATASGYFDTMLGSGLPESPSNPIILPDVINADTFEGVLQFIYTGEVMLTTENVYHLARAAYYLQLDPKLEERCTTFIAHNLPLPHMFDAVQFAWMTERETLLYRITHYISFHLEDFSATSKFLQLPFEIFKIIIDFSTLTEEIVIKTVVQWISHNRGERWHYFNQLSCLSAIAGVSSAEIKSIAQSLIPDKISSQDVSLYLEKFERTSIDESLVAYWKVEDTNCIRRLEVTIDDSIQCTASLVHTDFEVIREIALEKSHIYTLKFMYVDPLLRDYTNCIFYSACSLDEKLSRKLLEPPLIANSSFFDYFGLQMCGLYNSIKRIYLYVPSEIHLYVYYCDINEWYPLAIMIRPLHWAAIATCETKNTMYVMGGEKNGVANLHAYDCNTEKWKELTKSNCTYSTGTLMCVFNEKLYAYNEAHRKYEIYDPATNEWRASRPHLYIDAVPAGPIVAYRDELWLFRTPKKGKRQDSYIVYLYRPESDLWRKYPLIQHAVIKHGEVAGLESYYLTASVLKHRSPPQ